jgi:hypothetical protein
MDVAGKIPQGVTSSTITQGDGSRGFISFVAVGKEAKEVCGRIVSTLGQAGE